MDCPIDLYFQQVEDAVHTGTNRADGIPCCQQNRVILPGIKGVAQEGDGGQHVVQFETSVYGVVSRPGGGGQGHQWGRWFPL